MSNEAQNMVKCVGILISTPPIPSSSTYSLLSYTYSLPINLYFFVNSRLTYSHKHPLFTTHTSSHTSLHSKVLVDISLLTPQKSCKTPPTSFLPFTCCRQRPLKAITPHAEIPFSFFNSVRLLYS